MKQILLSLILLATCFAHADEVNVRCESALDSILEKPCYIHQENKNFILTSQLCTQSEKNIYTFYSRNNVMTFDLKICQFLN